MCFAVALRRGAVEVEGVKGIATAPGEARARASEGQVPVVAVGDGVTDWQGLAEAVGARVVVDARMLKGGHGLQRGVAGLAIGLGPGFTAGRDVDVVVETNRGSDLGRVIESGGAEADTGRPAPVKGYADERVIRSPGAGVFTGAARVGDLVEAGQVVGAVTPPSMPPLAASAPAAGGKSPGASVPVAKTLEVAAPICGLLRGLALDGTEVACCQKIGDVDPRGRSVDVRRISDKGRAVAGGVLEAIMHWWKDRDV